MRIWEFVPYILATSAAILFVNAIAGDHWPKFKRAVYKVVAGLLLSSVIGFYWLTTGDKPDETLFKLAMCPFVPAAEKCKPSFSNSEPASNRQAEEAAATRAAEAERVRQQEAAKRAAELRRQAEEAAATRAAEAERVRQQEAAKRAAEPKQNDKASAPKHSAAYGSEAKSSGNRDVALSIKPMSGRTFRDCPVCPEMVVVPPGTFDMGSQRRYNEKPMRQVRIPSSFAVGRYEVTFAEWDACGAAGGCPYRPSDESWGRDNMPVMNVSWPDTQQYLSWLGRKTGKTYRLLTEAEWEYAARAGTSTATFFGDVITPKLAHISGGTWFTHANRTVPVGKYKPNSYALYDMDGNVSEWVQDCYDGSYEFAPIDGTAVTKPNCQYRILSGRFAGDRS